MSKPWPRCTAPCDLPEGHPGQRCNEGRTPSSGSAYADGSYAPSECELACQNADRHVPGCPTLGDPITVTGQPRGVWPHQRATPMDRLRVLDLMEQAIGGSMVLRTSPREIAEAVLLALGSAGYRLSAPARVLSSPDVNPA